MAKLIIVQGVPASGKTTLSRKLAQEIPDLPLLHKDGIKEYLFDTLGIFDGEWSRVLGKASSKALLSLARVFLENERSIMLESAFYKDVAVEDIKSLNVPVLEIYCKCDEAVRQERYRKRLVVDRHPGHHNKDGKFDISVYAPLEVGELIYIDTTNGITDNDTKKLKEEIRIFLENQ